MIHLEIFSLLTFWETKTYLLAQPSEGQQALDRLQSMHGNAGTTQKVSLMCPPDRARSEHEMTIPVYGHYCQHREV
jgi:hypothetical protein